jgi:hypothetical protein
VRGRGLRRLTALHRGVLRELIRKMIVLKCELPEVLWGRNEGVMFLITRPRCSER